jgi:hypothetical protein
MRKIVICLAAMAIAVGGSTLTASAKKSQQAYRMYPREQGYYPGYHRGYYPDGYRRKRHVVIHIHPRRDYDGGSYPYDGRETHIHVYGKGRGAGSAGGGTYGQSPGSGGGGAGGGR